MKISKSMMIVSIIIMMSCGDEPKTYFDNTKLPDEHGTYCEAKNYGPMTEGRLDCTKAATTPCRCLTVWQFEKKFGKQ